MGFFKLIKVHLDPKKGPYKLVMLSSFPINFNLII